MTYILWSSDFASYLEDYLMEKCCTWDNGSVWLKNRPYIINVGQWPIFHGPLILPYIIIIDLNYFYTLRNGTGLGYLCLIRALALVADMWGIFLEMFVEWHSQNWWIGHLYKNATCVKAPVWNIPNYLLYELLLYKSAIFINETSASNFIPKTPIVLHKTAVHYLYKI